MHQRIGSTTVALARSEGLLSDLSESNNLTQNSPYKFSRKGKSIKLNKEMVVEAKRLDALRVYLSQGDQAKQTKNINILRKRGELNINDQVYRNTNTQMIPNDSNTGITSYLL
jgi:hypothetical protein